MQRRHGQTGILVIDKPPGITSRKAVDAVARLVRPVKAGHAGTLDPLASGVLVVCVGKATRLIEYVQRMPKTYRATFLLGCTSETEDVEGEIEHLLDPPRPTLAEISAACGRFTGRIMQRPPAYSAIKVAGRRAYQLARAGENVKLAPRPVTVHQLQLERLEYPELRLRIQCSSGTYIRSLGRDLAESVGTAAVMSELVRTEIGPFGLKSACTPEQLTDATLMEYLLPARAAVPSMPAIHLSSEQVEMVANGRQIPAPVGTSSDETAAIGPDGQLVAVMRSTSDGQLRVVRNLAPTR